MEDKRVTPLCEAGEEAALMVLERRGHTIRERGWECKYGSVDIVAFDNDRNHLVFTEVQTRMGAQNGFPEYIMDEKKRARYEKIAACYLNESDVTDCGVRFDVIAVVFLDNRNAFVHQHTNVWG